MTTPFPSNTLGITLDVLVNGTWTDISDRVYQRDDIVISLDRPNETSQIQSGSITLTLNNYDGSFSPLNSSGLFYPFLVSNMQIRLQVSSESATSVSYSGFRFWGEVPSWPPVWDPTGNDVYVQIQANGLLTRYMQGSVLGSALKRFYTRKTDATAPIALWTCEEQTEATQFNSSIPTASAMTWSGGIPGLASNSDCQGADPLPLFSGTTWTGNTNSYLGAGPFTIKTPGTYQWICPGNLTSITSVECTAGGGGGANARANDANTGGGGGGGAEYAKEANVAVTPANVYTLVVGSGGAGGYYANEGGGQHAGGNGGNSSFAGDLVTITAHGGRGGSLNSGGAGGSGSTNTTHFSGGAGASHSGTGSGHYGGAGGGGAAGSASAGNAGSANNGSNGGGNGGAAVTGGGQGGNGGNGGTVFGTPRVRRGGLGAFPGGGGGGGGEDVNSFAGFAGGSGAGGEVKLNYTSTSVPNNVVVRHILDIPAAGMPSNSVVIRNVMAGGTLTKTELYYTSGPFGNLGFRGYNGLTLVFDSGPVASTYNGGGTYFISMELAKSGSNIAWTFSAFIPGNGTLAFVHNGSFAGTMGSVIQVVGNPSGVIQDTCVGVIVLQYAYEDIIGSNLYNAINGYIGETGVQRLTRLCNEEGLAVEIVGDVTSSISVVPGNLNNVPVMGPQVNAKFIDLLQSIEDVDQGGIFESIDQFGIGYRTRESLQNQIPGATLDYSQAMLSSVPRPTYDNQFTRNDVTISRYTGGSVNAKLQSGARSILAPPNGVGDYPYSLTAYLQFDIQLPNMANWALAKGTLDEYRYPSISVDLSRSEVSALFAAIPGLRFGDFIEVTNMPSWLPAAIVKQLQWGRTETLNAFKWRFDFNCVPEDVYETKLNSNILAYSNSLAGWASAGTTTISATNTPPAGNSYPWALKAISTNGGPPDKLYDASEAWNILPSTGYAVEAWVWSTLALSFNIGFDWRTSAGVLISESVQAYSVPASTWVYLFAELESVSNAAEASIAMFPASGETYYTQHVVATPQSNWW